MRAAADSSPEAGYGVSVVPLQYVSAQTVIKLIDSFATKAGTIRADPARNLLLIQGTGAERRAAVETVLSFDVDWMRGQSVGIYPVRNSTPEPMIAELEKIMDSGEGGLSQSMVKFQPVGRLNAILVVTRKPELLRTAATWIKRLDSSDTASTGVKVYRVRYGEAQAARARCSTTCSSADAAPALDSPDNQIAPGAAGPRRCRAPSVSPAASPSPTTSRRAPAAAGGGRRRHGQCCRRSTQAPIRLGSGTRRHRGGTPGAGASCRACGSRPTSSTMRC